MADAGIHASEPVASIKGGDDRGGTYVAKELVYAYAMWISPKFALKVTSGWRQSSMADFGQEQTSRVAD